MSKIIPNIVTPKVKLERGKYHTFCDTHKRANPVKKYLTQKEKVLLVEECDTTCLFVMDYYISKSGIEGFQYTDDKTAKALHLTVRTVKRCRLALTNTGWFYQRRISCKDFTDGVQTFLGKRSVAEAINNSNIAKHISSTSLATYPLTIQDEQGEYNVE